MKKILKKYNSELTENVGIIALIIMVVSIFVFYVIIKPNDELWNFSNVYKMYNGEIIYQDCNVIITPLFFYIGEILFKLISPNYLVFRIYNLILFSIFYFLIYRLFRKLEISRVKSLTYLILIFLIGIKLILIGANYNTLALIFVLIGILYNLNQEKNKYETIIQGTILFLVFMAKQNIGILYLLGMIILNCVRYKEMIKIIKESVKQVIIFIVMFGIYCIYLALNHNLYNFFNYAFMGIFEFNESNMIFDNYIIFWILEIIFAIVIIFLINRKLKIDETIKNKITVLLSFAIPIMLLAYPIFNEIHIILSSIFMVITFIYFIDRILLKELMENKKIEKIFKVFNVICIIFFFTLFILINATYITNINNNIFKPYYGGILKNEESIEKVVKYIQSEREKGIEVKFISHKANMYNNILKINNGKIDLPFYGNLGIDGVKGLIEEIKNMKNTNILIGKEELKYQEPKEVIDFIKNNYKKIGEIEEFYIYKIGY